MTRKNIEELGWKYTNNSNLIWDDFTKEDMLLSFIKIMD